MSGPAARRPRWLPEVARPVRRGRAAVRAGRALVRGGATVLMYHHVADVEHDPWELAVSPAHFTDHLSVLRRSGRPLLRLDELRAALAAGDVPRRAVVVTFDDGYADNARVAVPALEHAGVPATVFVTSGALDGVREMWWDELERLILGAPHLPGTLSLDVAGVRLRTAVDPRPAGAGWRAGVEQPRCCREVLYHALWAQLAELSGPDQRAVLDALAAWAGVDVSVPRPTHRMLTSAELADLARSEVVEVGSHTVTHPSLPGVVDLEPELVGSRRELEARTGRPVTSFAYPSGRFDRRTVAAVAAAGYLAAATTRGGSVGARTDPLQIPRLMVRDVDGDAFARQLAAAG